DPNWGWNVVAGTYMMDFNAPAQDILLWISIVTIIAIGLGVAVIWLFANNISKPLTTVVNRMENLAAGDLTAEDIQIKSQDEIGLLANAMNTMQNHLKEMIEKI